MNFKSNKTTLILLGIAALGLSRISFLFINDPEGPNLVVVVGLAAIIYAVLLVLWRLVKKR